MNIITMALLAIFVVSTTHSLQADVTEMKVQYGQVSAIEVTTRESAVARNALIGSLVGVAIDQSLSGAVLGASTGFLVTGFIETDGRVFLYTLDLAEGERLSIAVKRPDLGLGHCAAIEQQGNHNNLRPVSAVHCLDDGNSTTTTAKNHRMLVAEKCREAREQLTKGGSDDEVEAALRNLRSYCD